MTWSPPRIASDRSLVVGVLTLSGGHRLIETRLVDVMPGWLMDLTTRF